MLFSMICCFDDQTILDKYFLKSLKEQSFKDFEIVLLQDKGQPQGAGAFLNQAASTAIGDYLVFCHADLIFPADFLDKLYGAIQKNPNFGILGFAGCEAGKNNEVIFSNMLHGLTESPAGEPLNDAIVDAQTVDECCFVIPRKTFHSFSDIGKTWHLYAVNYCLECISKGDRVFILPLSLYHKSKGASFSNDYFSTLSIIRRRFRKKTKYINTTIGSWPTNIVLYFLRTQKRKLYFWISKKRNRSM